MQVFLIRHAEAMAQTHAVADAHRSLTRAGRRQARALGDRLRWHDCVPTHIWVSPLVRAVQTAELVIAGLETELPADALPALAPDQPARAVLAALQPLPPGSVVLLFGHGPGLTDLASLLAGRPTLASLATAEALRIEDGALRWRFAADADAPEILSR
ncbi:MAG TPA: histidine phosphatase family protein [Kofleriaceae bacterium]